MRNQAKLIVPIGIICLATASSITLAQQDPGDDLSNIPINTPQLPLCFGFSDISDPRALAICDALNVKANVRARELSEQWVRAEPDSPAAQFALSEVLLTIEGNMPRALYHLNRAEALTNYNSLEAALNSGNLQWHYLTLSQLSYVHQLMGDQIKSLEYLDKINQIYGQDVESFRGWPLIKLKEYQLARESANRVLDSSTNERERARAWNTLCAVELASLQPIESMSACDQTINDENTDDTDTVYLSNASEVSLSLLKFAEAEGYLDRATRYLNPDSVADPWIYKMYLTMNQGRFDDARLALDRMLIWRESQEPIVSVMNRAEHYLVSASFLLLAGYAEDAIQLTTTSLNQPDRNGSYSADDSQKNSLAALLNMMAYQTQYQIALEQGASADLLERQRNKFAALKYRLGQWRAERRAASLFANFEVLQNRLRPYAPLEVHIPEWIEPEIVELIGTGVMTTVLNTARNNGAFMLNEGYYHSYATEIAALDNKINKILSAGALALSQLPAEEVLLRARINAHLAEAHWKSDEFATAHEYYVRALRLDPSILRRLELSIPVAVSHNNSEFTNLMESYLLRSPRFHLDNNGLILELSNSPDLSACLKSRGGDILSCYTLQPEGSQGSEWDAQELSRQFHRHTFGLGYDISKAQRSALLGSSVILRSQMDGQSQSNSDALLNR